MDLFSLIWSVDARWPKSNLSSRPWSCLHVSEPGLSLEVPHRLTNLLIWLKVKTSVTLLQRYHAEMAL